MKIDAVVSFADYLLIVMLNLFQHLVKSICYETLRFAQGDTKRVFFSSLSVCPFCLEHNPDRLEKDRYVKP